MKEMSVLLSCDVVLESHLIAQNRSAVVKNKEVGGLRRCKEAVET